MKGAIACAISAVATCLTSCTTPYQVRGVEPQLSRASSLDDVERDFHERVNLEARSIERYPEFSLGIIEFTDEGASNPEQERQVLDLLEKEGANGALIVVFAHGWHHGPRVCDRDLVCFRRVLQALHSVEEELGRGRPVLGVYLGWRGQAVNSDAFKFFTFWKRKDVAQHIGRTGGKEVLLRLDALHHRLGEDKVTMVTIGHSFGGALVFSAVKGKIIGNLMGLEGGDDAYRVARAIGDRGGAPEQPEVKALRARFGDLVVLVNPAIEADLYTPLFEDHRTGEEPKSEEELVEELLPYDKQWPYSREQLPVLLAVASTADSAVGRLFPIGRFLWTAVRPWRAFVDNRADRIGLGRYAPHRTHTLVRATDSPNERSPAANDDAGPCHCSKNFFAAVRGIEPLDLRATGPQDVADLVLAPSREDWDPYSPYWVVETSGDVISEHSDIFNETFVSFLVSYIRAYEAEKLSVPSYAAE